MKKVKIKKDIIDEFALEDFVEQLQEKYPPISEKNQKIAFREIIGKYPETIDYPTWKSIFRPGEKPQDVVNAYNSVKNKTTKRLERIDSYLYYDKEKKKRNYTGKRKRLRVEHYRKCT